jgi:hypothetical protein
MNIFSSSFDFHIVVFLLFLKILFKFNRKDYFFIHQILPYNHRELWCLLNFLFWFLFNFYNISLDHVCVYELYIDLVTSTLTLHTDLSYTKVHLRHRNTDNQELSFLSIIISYNKKFEHTKKVIRSCK